MNQELLRNGLILSLEEAEKALEAGNVPIGCVITDSDGKVIAAGKNETKTSFDTTAHAEVLALRKAGQQVLEKYNPGNTFLFTSLEPCFGCGFFVIRSNVKTIAWCLSDSHFGSVDTYLKIPQMKGIYEKLELISEPLADLKKKSSLLMVEYYRRKGDEEMARKFSV